ncbi:hypothetical protein [Moorena sp. SIO4A5]|uniref:hypothetical protein n=1 Tax=Moorena sp. SIO4A5 TaxID=2607838 RepID=UPI0025DE7A5C|nr:hypothetical protein [Moorena sp. SIO4A5]
MQNLKNKHRQHRGAKKPLLREYQLKKLAKELESRPSDGGMWTGPKVARWIEKETRDETLESGALFQIT